MINDIINNIEAILIGDTPAVKAYLGDTVIWEAPNDNEYATRSYRHQYFTTEALADNCVFSIVIGNNVDTSAVNGFYYSRDRITWTFIQNVSGQNLTVNLPAINTGEKYYWKGNNYAISQNGTYAKDKNARLGATLNFKAYGNMFSLLWSDDFIGKNFFPDDTTNYIYAGFFYNNTKLIDASNLYFPGLHTKGFTVSGTDTPSSEEVINSFNDTFNGCSNLVYGPIIEMLTVVGNGAMKRICKDCKKLSSITFYAIKAPTGKGSTDNYMDYVPNTCTIYLPTISTWSISSKNVQKTIDLSTIDFY